MKKLIASLGLAILLVTVVLAGMALADKPKPRAALADVETVDPMDGATGVDIDTDVMATFDVTMTNVSSATFTLEGPDGAVTGTVTYSTATQTATFDPDTDLEYETAYMATLSQDLADTAGITLGMDYTWTFTTEGLVQTVSPVDGATGVSLDANIEATFDVTMTNVSSATFTLKGPDGAVTGTVTYSTATQTATLDPDADLEYETTYTATLSKDLATSTGITLGTDYDWSFTTRGVPAPDVVITKTVTPIADVGLGELVTYTITIANEGDVAATGAIVTDELPSEVEFGGYVDDSNGTAQLPVAGVITWTYDVAASTSYSFVFTATVTAGTAFYGTDVTNTAYFTSTNAGSGSATAVFTIEAGFSYIYLPVVMRSSTGTAVLP